MSGASGGGPKGGEIKGLGIPFSEYQSRSFVNITFAAFGGRIMQASKQTSKQARYSASYTLIVYIIQGLDLTFISISEMFACRSYITIIG
jgi:hypothetical protein